MKKVLILLLVVGVLILGTGFAISEIPEQSFAEMEDFLSESDTSILPLGGEGGGSGGGGAPG